MLGQLRESKLTTDSLLEADAVPLFSLVRASDRRDHIACKVSFVLLCKVSVPLFSLVWALDGRGHIECKVGARSYAFWMILTEVL